MIDQGKEQELVALAIKAMGRAHCPYSNFPVGCALLDENGASHVGVNVENAAYPVGTCAEAGAIAAMAAAGGKMIVAIAVASKSKGVAGPCGACRQRIREFASLDAPILVCGEDGLRERFTLESLLPESFGPEHLLR